MKNFFVVAKDKRESTIAFAKALVAYIDGKGGSASYGFNLDDSIEGQLELPDGCECILSFGGDGTLIRAARNTIGSGVPLIGVNGGHLGYLCDLDKATVFEGIDSLFADDYSLEERMMLDGLILDAAGQQLAEAKALNDFVLSANKGLQVMTVTVYVNGSHLYAYNCDGMIISTPTGSTAYNLSANGPIVNPKTSLILLTPINAHTLNARSIVLDPNDVLEFDISPLRSTYALQGMVSFDGTRQRPIDPGQRLVIRRSASTTTMVHLQDISFLDRIRTKMQGL